MDAHLALKWDAVVGEGPVWDYRINQLYWVDILQGQLHRYDPQTKINQTYEIGQYVGAAVPCNKQGLILAMHHGWAFFNPENSQLSPISDPEADQPTNRFNDGKVDSHGRLWSGTMQINPQDPVGSLYMLDTNLEATVKIKDVFISNGLAWSDDDQWFYFIDSLRHKVSAYEFDPVSGDIKYHRDVFKVDPELGLPDGMTIDSLGNLWVAIYDGGCILCIDPKTGKVLEKIEVPAKKTSSCTFGGQGLDTLFITTISENTDPKTDPLAGSIFSVKPGVKGTKANFFGGLVNSD